MCPRLDGLSGIYARTAETKPNQFGNNSNRPLVVEDYPSVEGHPRERTLIPGSERFVIP